MQNLIKTLNAQTLNQRWLIAQALTLYNQGADKLMAFKIDAKHTLFDIAENLLVTTTEHLSSSQIKLLFEYHYQVKITYPNKVPTFNLKI